MYNHEKYHIGSKLIKFFEKKNVILFIFNFFEYIMVKIKKNFTFQFSYGEGINKKLNFKINSSEYCCFFPFYYGTKIFNYFK